MKSAKKSETLKAQAHRACATVREVLGRDPKTRVITGGPRLVKLSGVKPRAAK